MHRLEVRFLAHRSDDGLNRQFVGVALDGNRTPTSGVIGFTELHALDDHGTYRTIVVAEDLDGCRQVLEVDFFLDGLVDLTLDGRHLRTGATIEDGHLGAHLRGHGCRIADQSFGNARGVDGGVATTDDHHVGADVDLLARVGVVEELGPGPEAGAFLTRDAHGLALVGADGNIDRVVVFLDVVVGDIFTDLAVALEFDPEIDDALDLGVDDLARQPVNRNAVAEHATGFRQALKDRDLVAPARELIGARHSRGTCTDDRNLLLLGLFTLDHFGFEAVLEGPIPKIALDRVDPHRTVFFAAVAGGLTRMGADPTHHGREGVGLHLHVEGLFTGFVKAETELLAQLDDRKPAANVVATRAVTGARREAFDISRPQGRDLRADATAFEAGLERARFLLVFLLQ